MGQIRDPNSKFDLTNVFGIVRSDNLEALKTHIKEKGEGVLQELDKDGYTVMHWAVFESGEELVRYLLSFDSIDYDNSMSKTGQRPIHWASVKGRIEMVNLLLEKGVDINAQDRKGYTPLITSCQYGQIANVAFLVSRNAKIDIEDINCDTALHWAVYKGYPDITRLLIAFGINPKKIDNYGQTLLHLACISGNLNIVQQLIEQDFIDTEIKDGNGKKAIELAQARGFSNIVDYINRYNRDKRSSFCNLKTLLFGPVGNPKIIFIIIHLMFYLYEYPVFFLVALPASWNEMYHWYIVFILNTIVMWFSFYMVHFKNPGFLKLNTYEYHSALRKITFNLPSHSSEEWQRQLAKLCHTCKTIKPLRASHCRACNRCVLAYDHHCPYVQNCVGYYNRPWFSLFVTSMATLQYVTFYHGCFLFYKNGFRQYVLYPGMVITGFFALMATALVIGSALAAFTNLTGNEMAKRNRYPYLRDAAGNYKNIFDRGWWYNIKHYYHLVEPSYLEMATTDDYPNYTV